MYEISDDPSTVITRIERSGKNTIVTFEHAQSAAGWIALDKGIYLQNADGSDIYRFIKAEGIPLSPGKKELKGNEGKFTFKVYFERVPAAVKTINIVERAVPRNAPGSYFNFFGLSLSKSGGRLKPGGNYLQI